MKNSFDTYLEMVGEVGFVEKVVSPAVVYLKGLPGARSEEVVLFESGEIGMVMMLEESYVEVLRFSREPVRVGTRVVRTGNLFDVPVGEELLGSIINPLGYSLDEVMPKKLPTTRRAIEVMAPGINARARIMRPCETGVTLIDLMLPLGCGQRELLLGDQKSGKSMVLMRSLLTQVMQGSVGIYALIGKSKLAIHQVSETLTRMGIADKVVMVVSSADDSAGMVFITPYAAMSIAEYFRDKGRDVFLVLDDLSVHAKAYREISLLAKRFPGRNAYPGDMFYAHARLLERAGNFKIGSRECAITCLPVVEAVQGDITGYIQTNVMSMTDGHLFFDRRLFAQGRRPAIDPFISVTRVGHQTQSPLKQEIGRSLLMFLSDARKMHLFASFGAELSEHIRSTLEREEKIMVLFDQTSYDTVPPAVQIFLFGLIWGDAMREKTKDEVRTYIGNLVAQYAANGYVRERIDGIVSGSGNIAALLTRIREFDISSFLASRETAHT